MKSKINDLVNENLEQSAIILDTKLTSYKDMLLQVATDNIIVEFTRKLDDIYVLNKVLAANRIKARLLEFANTKSGIISIAVFSTGGNMEVYDKGSVYPLDNIWSSNNNITGSEIYIKATKNIGPTLEFMPYRDKNNGKTHWFFNYAMGIEDLISFHPSIGVVVVSFDESIISEIYSSNTSISEKHKIEGISFIVDQNGIIVSSTDRKFLGMDLHTNKLDEKGVMEAYKKIIGDSIETKRDPIINTFTCEQVGWTIVNAVDPDYLFKEMYWFQRMIIFVGILAIVFSISIILYVSNSFSKSIGSVVAAMKIVQKGELSAKVNLDTKDEISIIGVTFNQMMNKISQLMNEVKMQVQRVHEATTKQKEAEIRALEAQVNPHFLYNTLDSINWLAIKKKEYDISKLLKYLANILRYGISKSNTIVTVKEEIEWLEQYLFLQRYRFSNVFDCFIDTDEDVLSCKIHKLLFQPFVENAIIHGFQECIDGGVLKIKIGLFDSEYIKITIEDNGNGIDKEGLENLLEIINGGIDKGNIVTEGTGIGIGNVAERIKIYYGGKGSITVSSEIDKGTEVIVIIPRI